MGVYSRVTLSREGRGWAKATGPAASDPALGGAGGVCGASQVVVAGRLWAVLSCPQRLFMSQRLFMAGGWEPGKATATGTWEGLGRG